MKFLNYLNEGKLSTKEKKDLTKAIMNPDGKDLSINKHKVKVQKKNDKLMFTYDKDLWELTAALVDICDAMGLSFEENTKKENTTFTVNT